MNHGKRKSEGEFLHEKKIDLVFAGIALFFLILMIVLLIRYTGLRNENQSRPAEYGTVMDELNDVKNQKNELESKIDAITREINELNKKISALNGN